MNTTMPTPMTTPVSKTTRKSRREKKPKTGPILVATDGSGSADAALRAAWLLAGRTGSDVQVLAVFEPLPIIVPEPGFMADVATFEPGRKEALLTKVRSQIRKIGGVNVDWPLDIEFGSPATAIARTARFGRAQMIVLGLSRHSLADRLLSGETDLRVVRQAGVPVLIVAPDLAKLPHRVLVASDFSRSSVHAAQLALSWLGDYSMLYLVHVKPRLDLSSADVAGWDSMYESGIPPAFKRLTGQLEVPPGVQVETITLRGNPGKEMLEFAKSAGVDLIVAGVRGQGRMSRTVVGTVATQLVRGASCSLLIVPDAAVNPFKPERKAEWTDTITDPAVWAEKLEAFTKRNAQRDATLEVDDPQLGSQVEVRNYVFQGADFDHRSGRVELMMGATGGRHLTHGVSDVSSIDILVGADGRDAVLCVSHEGGQTLLTFLT